MYQNGNPYDLDTFMIMNERCPVCGQVLDLEPGFYYGTNLISYALSFCFSIVSFLLWWAIIGLSLFDQRLFWWIGSNAFLLIILQPPLMRTSRTIWLSFFVSYNRCWREEKPVEPEHINKGQMSNW